MSANDLASARDWYGQELDFAANDSVCRTSQEFLRLSVVLSRFLAVESTERLCIAAESVACWRNPSMTPTRQTVPLLLAIAASDETRPPAWGWNQ